MKVVEGNHSAKGPPAMPSTRQAAKHAALGTLIIFASSFCAAEIHFEEVTSSAGVSYIGSSFGGGSWGDVNGDAWPDLWLAGHFETSQAKLYVNNKNGTFTDEIYRINYGSADTHGSAWADFDNDGDQDLLMLVGAASGTGSGANQLFVNVDGLLFEQAVAHGLDYPYGRGRMPLWFDWNGDGTLDVFLSNWSRNDGAAPSRLFSQSNGVFVDSISETGLTSAMSNDFAQLIVIGHDNPPSLLISGHPSQALFDFQRLPFKARTDAYPLTKEDYFQWDVLDVAIADFNGDLLSDVFLVRQNLEASEAVQTDTNKISAGLVVRGDEKSFTFRANGVVKFQIEPSWEVQPSDIYIGNSGTNPEKTTFSISSTDAKAIGVLPHSPGSDFGVFIGFNPQSGLWQLSVSKSSYIGAVIKVTSEAPITGFNISGFVSSDGALNDRLLLQGDSSFSDHSNASGIVTPSACGSAVAADFDNDMDVDLYLVCQSSAQNRPNLLLENQGNGRFQSAPNAGGATGTSYGRGDGVSSVDYDRDGYMDLLVTNGRGVAPLNNGPTQLYRNTGGKNHWLEIDLEGVTSNFDGIGARVLITTNGVTQVRDLDGGIHRLAQNQKRLHFGLADNPIVDEIHIKWPSGRQQSHFCVPVDQVMQIKEGDELAKHPSITSIIYRGDESRN